MHFGFFRSAFLGNKGLFSNNQQPREDDPVIEANFATKFATPSLQLPHTDEKQTSPDGIDKPAAPAAAAGQGMTMALKISLHTSKRGQLLELAKKMAAAMEPEALSDASRPVTVSMRGSYSCGKKIFPDMFREALDATEKNTAHYSPALYTQGADGRTIFGRQIHKQGGFMPCEAEFWSGASGARPVELHLFDAGYILEGHPPSDAAVKEWQQTKEHFLGKRSSGGITFISNDERGAASCGIDIWLQSRRSSVKVGAEKDRASSSPLSKQFKASSDAWSRYIEITVTDERLLASPRFRQFIDEFKNPDNGYRQQGQENRLQKLVGKLTKRPVVSIADT